MIGKLLKFLSFLSFLIVFFACEVIPVEETVQDNEAPLFQGLTSAAPLSTTTVFLTWDEAVDNLSSPDEIEYAVYIAEVPDSHDFTQYIYSVFGSDSATVGRLKEGTEYSFAVRALDSSGNMDSNMITLQASTYTPDSEAPVFTGITSMIVLSDSSIRLNWTSAADLETESSDILYNIYVTDIQNDFDFTILQHSIIGETSCIIEGLSPYTTYYAIVRAEDTSGNEDSNSISLSAKTTDSVPPGFSGLEEGISESFSTITLSWTEAEDNTTLAQDLIYNIYWSLTAGTQDLSSPGISVTGVDSAEISGLSPDTEYFFVVRAEDLSGNEENNTSEIPITTLETIPPIFAGVLSASADNSYNSIDLEWSTATDNYSATSNITYNIYLATSSGEEDFDNPYKVETGVTQSTVNYLTSSTTYYFVVRAEDEANNEESNTIEISAVTASINTRVYIQANQPVTTVFVGSNYIGNIGQFSFPNPIVETKSTLVEKDSFYTISWSYLGNLYSRSYSIGSNSSYKFTISGINIFQNY